jgi:phage terminase large subunit
LPDYPQHATARCCWCRLPLILVEANWWCQAEECRLRQRRQSVGWNEQRWTKDALHEKFVFWWVPTPAQTSVLELMQRTPRLMPGGAAGFGKSDLSRKGAGYRMCLRYPGLSVLLLRKTFPELERTHIRAMRQEQHTLGQQTIFTWMEQAKECRFANGSIIECGHLDDDQAVQKYLSSEYDVIIFEEAVQYQPDHILELMSRLRSKPHIKEAGGPWAILPTNPGGPAHHLLKELFITHTPDLERYPAMARSYKPEQWVFFPAKLDDNPYIDPDYESLALTGLRKTRYEQLRHGDWDAAEGQFFEMFSARTHTRVLEAPDGAEWVEAFDWGYTQPAVWGAFVHVGDNHWHCPLALKQTKLEPEAWAALIRDARNTLGYARPKYAVADPKIFSEDRGESIADTFRRHKVVFTRAVNRRSDSEREMGWPRLASWFRFDPATVVQDDGGRVVAGLPWLTFDPDGASYLVRTIPALLADPHNPEDVDTTLDDHGADMCRYFAMSRPPLAKAPRPTQAIAEALSPAWFRKRNEIAPGVLG